MKRPAANAPLDSRQRPGRQAGRLSPHHESLRRAFPGLGRVEVEYDLPRPVRRASQITERPVPAVEQLSALPLGGPEPRIGRVVFRPGRTYADPAPRGVPIEAPFQQTGFELGVFAPVPTGQLSFPLPAFGGAFAALRRHRGGGLVGQLPEVAAAGDVILLRAPSSWGAAARGRAFGVVEVEDRAVYAFEMLRRHRRERISLGLVMRADGLPMSPANISAVARHAIGHLSLRATKSDAGSRGIWPSPSQFHDLRGRIMPHTLRRRLPGLLAEDLDELARSLATPEPA